MSDADKGNRFMKREGDTITFNLHELRRAAQAGRVVIGILVEDLETIARRVGDYAGSVRERTEARTTTKPQGTPEALVEDPEPIVPRVSGYGETVKEHAEACAATKPPSGSESTPGPNPPTA